MRYSKKNIGLFLLLLLGINTSFSMELETIEQTNQEISVITHGSEEELINEDSINDKPTPLFLKVIEPTSKREGYLLPTVHVVDIKSMPQEVMDHMDKSDLYFGETSSFNIISTALKDLEHIQYEPKNGVDKGLRKALLHQLGQLSSRDYSHLITEHLFYLFIFSTAKNLIDVQIESLFFHQGKVCASLEDDHSPKFMKTFNTLLKKLFASYDLLKEERRLLGEGIQYLNEDINDLKSKLEGYEQNKKGLFTNMATGILKWRLHKKEISLSQIKIDKLLCEEKLQSLSSSFCWNSTIQFNPQIFNGGRPKYNVFVKTWGYDYFLKEKIYPREKNKRGSRQFTKFVNRNVMITQTIDKHFKAQVETFLTPFITMGKGHCLLIQDKGVLQLLKLKGYLLQKYNYLTSSFEDFELEDLCVDKTLTL